MLKIRIEWRRVLIGSLVLLLFVLVGLGGRFLKSRTNTPKVRVGGPIPYTVITKEIIYASNGSFVESIYITQAVRSDGSIVFQVKHKNNSDEDTLSQRTLHFASGVRINTDDLAQVKNTILANSVNPAELQRDPNSQCLNSFAGKPVSSSVEHVDGEEMIEGYRTVKIVDKNTIMWLALDYGCARVKSRMDFGGGNNSGHNLVALISQEPEDSLFDIPATIKEVSPSERFLMSRKNAAQKCDEKCTEYLRKLDESYYKHRPVN